MEKQLGPDGYFIDADKVQDAWAYWKIGRLGRNWCIKEQVLRLSVLYPDATDQGIAKFLMTGLKTVRKWRRIAHIERVTVQTEQGTVRVRLRYPAYEIELPSNVKALDNYDTSLWERGYDA